MIIDEDVYIEHFGVKGMHWGVRIEKARQTRREKQVKIYETQANRYQKQIETFSQKSFRTPLGKHQNVKNIRYVTKLRDKALKDAEAKRQGKLSSDEKKIIIGAAVVGGILLYKYGGRPFQSGAVHQKADLGRMFVQGKLFSPNTWKVNGKLARTDMDEKELFDKVVKPINPHYGPFKYGGNNNCRRCTFAYEMRRRGYDVAATRTGTGIGQDASGMLNVLDPSPKVYTQKSIMSRITDRTKSTMEFEKVLDRTGGALGSHNIDSNPFTLAVDREKIFSTLGQHPEGARGELAVAWKMGGAHSLAWEIIGGKPVIMDTQSGKIYKTAKEIEDGLPDMYAAGFTRLDNIQLDENFLMRWVKNAA